VSRGRAYDQEALSLARRANHLPFEARALLNLGYIAYILGDYTAARAYGLEALERSREIGARFQTIIVLGNLAQADLKLGDTAAARRGARESLALAHELGYMPSVVVAVVLFGQILNLEGDKARALALYGLARSHPSLEHQISLEIEEELARFDLSADEIEAGLAAGAALDFSTVLAEILDGKW
jgi:tetratricopeptide (TPR) repeat protein